MSFDAPIMSRRRIAVIGGGISGMGAAHFLGGHHDVTLYEAEPRLGGHARTVTVDGQPVDTGFIVFNRVNYPRLVRLFEDLGVRTAQSDMSFAASLSGGAVEYGLKSLATLFAQPANAVSPGFLGMCRDILRFNARARTMACDPSMTVADLIKRLRLGARFRDHYLLPLSGAIWSSPEAAILEFPAQAMVRFFDNHALLNHRGQHQWHTVRGGSVEYVTRLSSALKARGVTLRTGEAVETVRRGVGGVAIRSRGSWDRFDEVVLATHADDSLKLLERPSRNEAVALAAVRYQPNDVVLHSDPAVMPRRRRVWSAWNYLERPAGRADRIALSYWMNALQPIPGHRQFFVTLNGASSIDPGLIHDAVTFRHPVYSRQTLAAQDRIRGLQGTGGTWFCGAWMRNGFHEDGLASAADVAEAMLARPALGMVAQ